MLHYHNRHNIRKSRIRDASTVVDVKDFFQGDKFDMEKFCKALAKVAVVVSDEPVSNPKDLFGSMQERQEKIMNCIKVESGGIKSVFESLSKNGPDKYKKDASSIMKKWKIVAEDDVIETFKYWAVHDPTYSEEFKALNKQKTEKPIGKVKRASYNKPGVKASDYFDGPDFDFEAFGVELWRDFFRSHPDIDKKEREDLENGVQIAMYGDTYWDDIVSRIILKDGDAEAILSSDDAMEYAHIGNDGRNAVKLEDMIEEGANDKQWRKLFYDILRESLDRLGTFAFKHNVHLYDSVRKVRTVRQAIADHLRMKARVARIRDVRRKTRR